MYFHDFAGLFHVFFSGIFAYAILVVFLRVSGKRTLSKMNSFDFVVTIALGSTLAATIVNTSIPHDESSGEEKETHDREKA